MALPQVPPAPNPDDARASSVWRGCIGGATLAPVVPVWLLIWWVWSTCRSMAAVSDKCHDTLYSKYSSSTPIPETDGGPGWRPSADQVEQFRIAGCMIVRKFITTEEHKRLKSECDREDGVKQFAFERDDGEGRKSKM